MKKLDPYDAEMVEQMKNLYQTYTEKDRRRYAAIEAKKLGYGGISYICRIFGCDEKSVNHGLSELENLLTLDNKRIRKSGGGSKKVLKTSPGIDDAFLSIMSAHTAGSPVDETIKWSNLGRKKIAEEMAEQGYKIGVAIVDQLLDKHNFRRRKAFRNEAGKEVENRNEQFENIEKLVEFAHGNGNPAMSMDVKKKELIGNFHREGNLYTQERVHVNDHDFRSLADGMAVPHGLYDMAQNIGYLTIGTSHDTSEFAIACIRCWWLTYGIFDYPYATEILLLCDCGGSNNARYYIFKQDLQDLANELNISIRIAHYPPYTSKYNPIEHRLFPHVTRACQGVVFKTFEIARTFMAKTSTKTGLTVFVSMLDTVFHTKRSATDHFKENMPILFDAFLPKWNYVARPQLWEVHAFI